MKSFKLYTKPCECGPCNIKRLTAKSAEPYFDKWERGFIQGAYLFCSILIIFGLLVGLNAFANQPELNRQNLLINFLEAKPSSTSQLSYGDYLPDVNQIWFETILAVDSMGASMGEPLADTIALYSRGIQKSMVTTGEALAKVPGVLISPAPYAMASR